MGFNGSASDAAHSDVIDLAGIGATSTGFNTTYSGGVLTVTVDTHTAQLTFGKFTDTFNLATDGNGGTLIYDAMYDTFELGHFASQPAATQWMQLIASEEHGNTAIDPGDDNNMTLTAMTPQHFQAILSSAVHLHWCHRQSNLIADHRNNIDPFNEAC